MPKSSQIEALMNLNPLGRAEYCWDYIHEQNSALKSEDSKSKLLNKDKNLAVKEDLAQLMQNSHAFDTCSRSEFYSDLKIGSFNLPGLGPLHTSLIEWCMERLKKCGVALPDKLYINDKLSNQESYWYSNAFGTNSQQNTQTNDESQTENQPEKSEKQDDSEIKIVANMPENPVNEPTMTTHNVTLPSITEYTDNPLLNFMVSHLHHTSASTESNI